MGIPPAESFRVIQKVKQKVSNHSGLNNRQHRTGSLLHNSTNEVHTVFGYDLHNLMLYIEEKASGNCCRLDIFDVNPRFFSPMHITPGGYALVFCIT